MTADDKNPIEEAVDQAMRTFVYAPIGLLFDGPARFPKLVRNGRNQVTNARMMGQFAVQMGRTEVNKRASGLDGPVVDLLRGLGVIDGPPPGPAPAAAAPVVPVVDAPDKPEQEAAKQGSAKTAAPRKPAGAKGGTKRSTASKAPSKKAPSTKAPSKKAASKQAGTPPTAAALPITDYDSLSASQVVSRLQGLSAGELEAVRSYEAATRGRKTILNRVQQLLKP